MNCKHTCIIHTNKGTQCCNCGYWIEVKKRYIWQRLEGVLSAIVSRFSYRKGNAMDVQIQVGDVVMAVNKENADRFRIGKAVDVTEKGVSLLSSYKDEPKVYLAKKNSFFVLHNSSL